LAAAIRETPLPDLLELATEPAIFVFFDAEVDLLDAALAVFAAAFFLAGGFAVFLAVFFTTFLAVFFAGFFAVFFVAFFAMPISLSRWWLRL
jgi:hypothetical protein